MSWLNIGEFSRLCRLSPNALRLYDELGLLRPARVDPASGYRSYEPSQLERARLVAMLRRVGMPLARISSVVELVPAAAAGAVAVWWAEAEASHAACGELADYLVQLLKGEGTAMYDVTVRHVPWRHLLCLERHVEDEQGVWALGKEFVGIVRRRPLPPMEGTAGAVFLVYYGEVGGDSDGPVAFCRPVPAERSEELAGAVPEFTLRTEPAHEEAFVHLGTGETTETEWQMVSQSLHAWGVEHDRGPSTLGVRVTLMVPDPASAGAGPDRDFAVPLR